jgi:hypothetical protein
MKYKIVSMKDPNPKELENVVNLLILEGWEPVGGVAHEKSDGEDVYHQAMIQPKSDYGMSGRDEDEK